MFRPVQNLRLSDKVVQQIVQAIHSGELKKGERLPPETQMAEQFGISRGILREALNILQARGYITRMPKGGTVISSTSDNDIGASITTQVRAATAMDLLEFRQAMECTVVQKVIDNATDEEIRSLYAFCQSEQHESIDYYFHYRLAEYSGNPLFVVFLDMYYDSIREIARGGYADDRRSQQIQQEHLRIVKAIEERNREAAISAVREHFQNVAGHLERRHEV